MYHISTSSTSPMFTKSFYLAFLLPCLFVFSILFVKTQWRQSDIYIVQSECEEFLNFLNIQLPSVLIDLDLLKAMEREDCKVPKKPIKIAVDENHLSKPIPFRNSTLNIIYFKTTQNQDYLELSSQLIPKNFENRKIGQLQVPLNIKMFEEFFKRSKYIKCSNRIVERQFVKDSIPAQDSADSLALLRDELLQFGMLPFLSDGTLLGWYRECSVIPHTSDMDLAVFNWEFNLNYTKHLKDYYSSNFQLIRKLGMLHDSYELTVVPKASTRIPIDIFLMYKDEKEYYTGGMDGEGNKIKWVHESYDPWCATDLLGHIFWVSCTPEDKLKATYGEQWYLDHPSDRYGWNTSPKNQKDHGKWSQEEMKRVNDPFL